VPSLVEKSLDAVGDYFSQRDPEKTTTRLVRQLEALGHNLTLQPGRRPREGFDSVAHAALGRRPQAMKAAAASWPLRARSGPTSTRGIQLQALSHKRPPT